MEKEEILEEEIGFADCLTCNEIKEMPVYAASRTCKECGDPVFITAG